MLPCTQAMPLWCTVPCSCSSHLLLNLWLSVLEPPQQQHSSSHRADMVLALPPHQLLLLGAVSADAGSWVGHCEKHARQLTTPKA